MSDDLQSSDSRQGTVPACPLCGGTEFRKELGKLDSRWGFTAHRIKLLICVRCQFIMQFYGGRSIWDID